MTVVRFPDTLYSASVRGKFGTTGGYGVARYAGGAWGVLERLGGIFKRHRVKGGHATILMPYYRPKNPQTPTQQAWRAQMTAAWSAWGVLTADERALWYKRAVKRGLSGPNLFVSDYLQRHR